MENGAKPKEDSRAVDLGIKMLEKYLLLLGDCFLFTVLVFDIYERISCSHRPPKEGPSAVITLVCSVNVQLGESHAVPV